MKILLKSPALVLFPLLLISCSPPPAAYDDYTLALEHYLSGETDEALRVLDILCREYPRFTEASLYYGRVLFYTGSYSEAAERLERGLEGSERLDSMKLLLRCYLQTGEEEKARELLLRAGMISPDDPELLYLRALCRIAEGEEEQAMILLKTACSLLEGQIEIPLKLASLYSRYGLYHEAEDLVGRALHSLSTGHPLKRSLEALHSELGQKKTPP